ncbi:hypothetical protein TKK_0008356 [Trichogramma kaykai]|uniref:Kaptin n=1 Tax=Trichogramma kaykai TaxID=54128 RepID=A0ABD2X5H2_9HYME
MVKLMQAHWFPLSSQGNIYTLTFLQSCKGSAKILVACLNRKIYSCEYHKHSEWHIKPLVKELLFTYIPSGAEIIAIDAYNKSTTADEFVIGISIIKPTGETCMERYLNIYSEGAGDGDDSITSLESIAQSCLMVELSYTPYLLYHTIIPKSPDKEIVWLISGSDYKIHGVREDKQNHSYTEFQLDKFFPELDQLKAIALWIDIYYYDDFQWRLTAISCECGLFKLAKVNVDSLEIIQKWSLRYDNPVSSVRIFPNKFGVQLPACLNVRSNELNVTKDNKINVMLTSGNKAVVFQNILHNQLDSDITLGGNELTSDFIVCSCIADINMDGKNEILLGTYKQEVLIYESINDTWKLTDKKLFDAPVHSIKYLDLAGDGVKVLVIQTQRSVHILQHDPQETMNLWSERFSKLVSLLDAR